MIKVLILEDTQADFEAIKSYLEKHEAIETYPCIYKKQKFLDSEYGSDWHHIRETFEVKFAEGKEILEKFYDKIIDTYKSIDIYIIDINLINLEDRIGVEFVQYSNKKIAKPKHYILISTNTIAGEINLNESHYTFVSKYNSISHIENELSYRVSNLIEVIKKRI